MSRLLKSRLKELSSSTDESERCVDIDFGVLLHGRVRVAIRVDIDLHEHVYTYTLGSASYINIDIKN